jgi:hypothetical protein
LELNSEDVADQVDVDDLSARLDDLESRMDDAEIRIDDACSASRDC